MDHNSLALIAMSAIFFTPPGVILLVYLPVTGIHFDFPGFSFNYFAIVPIVLGIISLCGCIISLILEKKQTTNWYWGIPLCVATAVVIIASLLFLTGIPFIGWNALQSFILLAPCAALFFYAEKKANGSGTGLVIISLVVSIVAAILVFGIIFPHDFAPVNYVLMNPFDLLFSIYYLLGLPVVGALFLYRAFGVHRRDGGTLPGS